MMTAGDILEQQHLQRLQDQQKSVSGGDNFSVAPVVSFPITSTLGNTNSTTNSDTSTSNNFINKMSSAAPPQFSSAQALVSDMVSAQEGLIYPYSNHTENNANNNNSNIDNITDWNDMLPNASMMSNANGTGLLHQHHGQQQLQHHNFNTNVNNGSSLSLASSNGAQDFLNNHDSSTSLHSNFNNSNGINGYSVNNTNNSAFLLQQQEQQQEQQQQQQHPEDPYRHHKRSREISAEEIQVQFLDQVEEFQLAQSIAVRSMVQQQIYEQQMMAHAGTTGLIDSAISSRSSSSSMLPTSSSSSAFDQQSYRTAGSSDSGTVSNQGQQQQQYYGQPLNNTRQFQGLPYAQQQQQQQQHHQQQQQQQQRLQQQKENSMQSQSNSGTGFPQSPSSSRTTPRPSTAPFYHSSPSELNQQNQQASNFYNPCDGYPSTAIRLQSQQQKLPQQQQSVQPSQQQQPESGQQTSMNFNGLTSLASSVNYQQTSVHLPPVATTAGGSRTDQVVTALPTSSSSSSSQQPRQSTAALLSHQESQLQQKSKQQNQQQHPQRAQHDQGRSRSSSFVQETPSPQTLSQGWTPQQQQRSVHGAAGGRGSSVASISSPASAVTSASTFSPKPFAYIPSFPYFPPAIQKYSPELSPAPSDDASEGTGSSRKSMTPTAKATLALNPGSSIDGTSAHQDQNGVKDKDKDKDDSLRRNSKTASSTSPMSSTLSSSTFSKDKRTTTTSQQSTSTSPTSATIHSTNNSTKGNNGKKTVIMRAPFPARAPAPPRGVAQLEEAMKDIRLYDSCLFWGKSGAVNLKPEGNSWDDDMVIQSKDPAWVRSSVPPPLPTNQELLILPPVAKIEKSIDVFLKNSHLYPPFITPLIVEQAKQTRSNLISRILLNTIAGIAIRIDPQIEQSTSKAGSSDFNASTGKKTTDANKQKYMRYFNRAYGLMIHLEDIRSTYSVTYLQATMLLCHVYPKPQLRVELLKLLTESAFLGLHVDCTRWMPKPIVIQNRTWLFWTCYIFDSVHHVVRGELSQMDDHYLEAPFPALTELDHDDGLWTRWFMLKEINLWRIGRKIHSYFQSQLKEKDRLVEASRKAVQQSQGSAQGQRNKKEPQQPAYFLNFPPEDILSSEYSEAELVLSLKLWTDDLPARLTAHIDSARLDRVDPRVNGRAVGLQAVFSMLKILLLYPNMLLIGTDLLSPTLPLPSPSLSPTSSSLSPQPSSSPMEMSLSSSSSSSSTPSPLAASTTSASHIPQIPIPGGGSALGLRSESISGTTPLSTLSWQQQIAQQQHSMRRKDYLDKIMQCVQEADRLVMWSTLIMERYPERARMACVGAGLDWCLRIYDKILMENKNLKTSSSTNGATNNPLLLSATPSSTFSPRFRSRCRGQVSKIAKLLQMFEDLDHRYYFSWLTIDLESLEERQKTSQQKMIERCLKVDKTSSTTAKVGVTGASSSMTTGTAPQQLSPNQNQILDLQDVGGVSGVASGREKVHDMESIIRKRTQMGVYALSGIQPNGGFPYGSGLGPDQQQQQQSTVLSNGGITGSSAGAFAFSGVSTSIADVPEVNDNGHWPLFDNIGISSSSTTLSSSASTGILSNSSIDSNNMYRNPNDNLMLSSMPFSSSTGQPQPIYHFEYNAAPQTLSNSSSSSSVLTTASYTPQQQGGPMPMFSSSRSSGGFDARFYPQGVSMSNSFPSTTTTGLTLIPSTGNNGEATALPLNVTTAMVGQQTLSSNNTMPSSSSLDLFFN